MAADIVDLRPPAAAEPVAESAEAPADGAGAVRQLAAVLRNLAETDAATIGRQVELAAGLVIVQRQINLLAERVAAVEAALRPENHTRH